MSALRWFGRTTGVLLLAFLVLGGPQVCARDAPPLELRGTVVGAPAGTRVEAWRWWEIDPVERGPDLRPGPRRVPGPPGTAFARGAGWDRHTPGATTATGEAGRFVLALDRPGCWFVVAAAPDGRLASDLVTVDDEGPPAEVSLHLATGGRELAGRIEDARGAPWSGSFRVVRFDRPARLLAAGRTDAQGRFRVGGLPDGPVWLTGLLAGDSGWVSRRLEGATPDLVLRLDLRDAALHARAVVRSARDGKPVPGAHVLAMAGGVEAGILWRSGVGGEDGAVDLPLDAAQVTRWIAFAPGYEIRGERGSLPEAGIVLTSLHGASGTVVTEGEKPVPGLRVLVLQFARGLPAVIDVARTDDAGRFEVRGAEPGPWFFHVLDGGWAARGLADAGPVTPSPLVRTMQDLAHEVRLVVEPAAAIAGTVRDAQGTPLAGAWVEVVAAESTHGDRAEWLAPRGAVRTDAAGHYRLPSVAPHAKVELEVRYPGNAPERVDGVVAPAPGQALALDVALAPPRFVDFRFVDAETGVALPGTTVHVAREKAGLYFRFLPVSWQADAEGRALVGPLPRGVLRWVAHRPDDPRPDRLGRFGLVGPHDGEPVPAPDEGPRDPASGWPLVVARLPVPASAPGSPADPEAPRSFTLRVVGPDGSRVARGDLELDHQGSGRGEDQVLRDGVASVRVPRDVVRFWLTLRDLPAVASGHPAPAEGRYGPFDAGALPAELRLDAAPRIEGVVVGPDGEGVGGAVLAFLPAPLPGQVVDALAVRFRAHRVRADATGRFVVDRLRAGSWCLALSVPPAYAAPEARVLVLGTGPLRLQVRKGVEVEVRVLDAEGRPVVAARVEARRGGQHDVLRDRVAQASTGAEGVARLAGLDPASTLVLRVMPPEDGADRMEPAELEAWKPADVTVRLGRLHVTRGVVLGPDDKPPGWVVLYARKAGSLRVVRCELDEEGRFEIGPRPMSKLQLRAFGRSTRPGPDPSTDGWQEVDAGRQDVVVRYVPGATLAARVADWQGGEDVSYHLATEGEPASFTGYGDVGEDGSLEVWDLDPARTYTLWIRPDAQGRYVLATGLSAGGESHVLALQQGRPVRGRLDAPGALSFAHVTLDGPLGSRVEAEVAEDGSFVFPGLPPGRWRVTALGFLAKEGRTCAGKAIAEAGQAEPLTITLASD